MVYKEYGLTIWLPEEVFNIGPHTVIDQHCGGSFKSYWSLSEDAAIGLYLNKSISEETVLQIDDSILLPSFTLKVTGTYSYGSEKHTNTIEQKY